MSTTVSDWPADDALFDDPDREFPPLDQCKHLFRRGRWRPIEDGPSLDGYQGDQQAA